MMPVGFGAGLESDFSDVQKISEVDTFDKELTEGFAGDDYDSALSEAFSPGERFHKTEDTGDGAGRIEKARYYDDAGKEYRVGNDLLPNNSYEINGYSYSTDEFGRILSAEGTLHMKNREGRLPIRDSIEDIGKGDQRSTDDRGHLIGDQFDGSNGMENMIPQDAGINRNDFKNFENDLAAQVKDGKEVYVKVEPLYESDSRRPEAVLVSYSVNGNENYREFPNTSGGVL